jgi:hypothetical protein
MCRYFRGGRTNLLKLSKLSRLEHAACERALSAWQETPLNSRGEIRPLQGSACLRLLFAWQKRQRRIPKISDLPKDDIRPLQRLLQASSSLQIPELNPFRENGVMPLERHTRDFLMRMLDPAAPHGLSRLVLKALLQEARRTGSLQTRTCIDAINALVPRSEIIVKREETMRQARPDVVITGPTFIIAIEIKRATGIETMVGKIPQSARLHSGTLKYAADRGIAPERIMIIFLTPDGRKAAHPSLIPISTRRLFPKLDRVLDGNPRCH